MKKIKTYIGIMAALLTMLTACSDSMVDNGVPSKNETGTYQAHFTISVPNYSKVESRVANFATEGIASANDMKLLCFDKDGYFLGLARNLTIESVPTNDIKADGGSDQKNITATIPTGTARIHIMANATAENTVTTGNQSIDFNKSAEWIGRHENNLMTSFDNRNNYQQHDKMVYWGYVMKKTPEEMTEFLTKVVANNVIHLLRNRAKIEVKWEDTNIENIRYALGNVMQHGTVAPFNRDKEKLTFPDTNMLTDEAAWKTECTYITPSLDPTRWPSEGEKFSVENEEMWPNTKNLPMQYTFEQENSLEKPLKVIMEVTYKGGETKWFQVLLQNKGVQIPVKRNHLYRINIKKLGKNLGYTDCTQAYEGTPANNPWITVDDIIQEISDGNFTMNIVEGTYQILTAESEDKIQEAKFTYKGDDTMEAENFDVSWTQNEGFTNPDPVTGKLPVLTVEYNANTGEGVIKYQVGSIGEDFKKATIKLVDKRHGLTRNIHLYSIRNVDFNFQFANPMGKAATATANLTLTIPANYPKELLPIEIEIASNDVNPIGSDVKVASTADVYEGCNWNCWFVTKYENPIVLGTTQTITMKNVRKVSSSTNTGTFYIKAKHYNGNQPKEMKITYKY